MIDEWLGKHPDVVPDGWDSHDVGRRCTEEELAAINEEFEDARRRAAESSSSAGPSTGRGDSADSATFEQKKHDTKQSAGASSSSSSVGTFALHSLDIGHGCELTAASPITADMFTVELSDAVPTLDGYDVHVRSVVLDINVVPGSEVPFPLRLRMPHTASREELEASSSTAVHITWMRSTEPGVWEVVKPYSSVGTPRSRSPTSPRT